MWSRNKANLYIQDALNEFEPDFKHHCLSPPAQHRMYRQKLMLTHLVGFGGGGSPTGTSYSFDGAGDGLTLADNIDWRPGDSGTGDFTIDMWWKAASTAADGIYGQFIDGNNYWQLFVSQKPTTGQFVWRCKVSGVEEVNYIPTQTIASFGWHHIAIIKGQAPQTFT